MTLLHFTAGGSPAGPGFFKVWGPEVSAALVTATEPFTIVPAAGVLRGLHVQPRVAGTGADTLTVTVRVNGVATAITVTMTEADATADDAVNSVNVSAGDRVSLRCTTVGAQSGIGYRAVVEYAITSVGEAVGTAAGTSTAVAEGSSIAESIGTAAGTSTAEAVGIWIDAGPRAIWTLPEAPTPSPPVLSGAQAMFGRDIRFREDFTITRARDWAVVDGVDAVKQSILNEAMTSPGEFALRPEYGMGLADAVKRPSSRSVLDALTNRVRDRLARNPRVTRVKAVAIESVAYQGGVALRVTIQVEAAGRDLGPGTGLDPFVIGAGGLG